MNIDWAKCWGCQFTDVWSPAVNGVHKQRLGNLDVVCKEQRRPLWWGTFHDLWTKAVGKEGYNKQQWMTLEVEIWAEVSALHKIIEERPEPQKKWSTLARGATFPIMAIGMMSVLLAALFPPDVIHIHHVTLWRVLCGICSLGYAVFWSKWVDEGDR